MKLTFDNILDQVVHSRTITRKEKWLEIHQFLKENSGERKPKDAGEIAILETLKAVKKDYLQKDKTGK